MRYPGVVVFLWLAFTVKSGDTAPMKNVNLRARVFQWMSMGAVVSAASLMVGWWAGIAYKLNAAVVIVPAGIMLFLLAILAFVQSMIVASKDTKN